MKLGIGKIIATKNGGIGNMRDKTRINEKAQQLISLTTEFCEQHLNDEYEQLCEKRIFNWTE